MNLTKKLAAAAVAFAFAGAALAGQVVLYSSNNVDTLNFVKENFQKKYPDISVSVVRAGSGSLMKRIKAESKNPMGDMFWSGGLSTIDNFKDDFEAYKTEATEAVAPEFRDPDGKWLGTNTHVAVLMANVKQCPDGVAPKSWKDLTDPKWKGKITMPDPGRSGTAYSTLYGLRALIGDADFEKIVKNAVIAGTSAGAFEGPARGEFAVGITMEYAANEYVAGGLKEIQIVYPSEGTFLMPEGMCIIKGAKHMDEAKKLYDYLSSAEAQIGLFKLAFRRPLRGDIDVSKYSSLPEMGKLHIIPVDGKKSAGDRENFLKFWNALLAK